MTYRLAIIPAREGSKRIKNKNISSFYQKPIIYHPLDTIVSSKLFNKIHISTDSIKIKKIIEKKNIKVDFLRPKKLSTDRIGLKDVINYVLKKYSERSIYFDEVWIVYSTAVLLNKFDLKKASKIFSRKDVKRIISVTKFPAPIEWGYKIENSFLKPLNKSMISLDSSIFEPRYFENASFVAYKLEKKISIDSIKTSFFPFEMPFLRSFDVDEPDDLKILKKLYKIK